MDEISTIFSNRTVTDIACFLKEQIQLHLAELYGRKPDVIVAGRFHDEWARISEAGINDERSGGEILSMAALYELTVWLQSENIPYWCAGTAGSSFLLYLLGVTNVNPLPPHFRCPKCGKTEWLPEKMNGITIRDGFDACLIERRCPNDGTLMIPDGHDLPWLMLWGSGQMDQNLLTKLHLQEVNFELRTTATAVGKVRECIDHHWLHQFYKDADFEKMPHDDECMLRLPHITLNGHMNTENLNSGVCQRKHGAAVWKDYLQSGHWKNDMLRLHADYPEAYPNLHEILEVAPDRPTFSELVYMYGMNHSTGVWDKMSKNMILDQGYLFSQMPVFREDAFTYFLGKGCTDEEAWYNAMLVSRGKQFATYPKAWETDEDNWILQRFRDTRSLYLFPKAHVIEL